MPGGLTLLASLNGDIPTPAAGKVTIFFSLTSGVPSYKDSAGVVFPLGTTGATGPAGTTLPFALDDSISDFMLIPGPAGSSGAGTDSRPKSTSVLTSGTGATYTVPAGITAIIVECIGGGGGGGGADASGGPQSGAGGGGGGGSYSRKVYTVTPAQAFTYTIGTGGAGGAAGNNVGIAGNNTTFDNAGSIVTATGGTGGAASGGAGTTFVVVGGGVGGAPTGGQLNMRGPSRGGSGFRLSGSQALGGIGGHSMFGPGAPNNNVDATAANAIAGMGGGGAGATALTAGRAGGNGADGFIVITEFGT